MAIVLRLPSIEMLPLGRLGENGFGFLASSSSLYALSILLREAPAAYTCLRPKGK